MKSSTTDTLRTAINTAEYFGFTPLSVWQKHPVCKSCKQPLQHNLSAADRKLDSIYGILSNGAKNFADNNLHSLEAPVFFYSLDSVPRSGDTALSLQIFGVPKSIAEAVLIQTSSAILTELGRKNHVVRINSLGDRDSGARYYRELNNFLKKRLIDMPPEAREKMKDSVCSALMHLIEKDHELAYKTPNPLEYLSDQSRRHFREIIEYMDMSETPYEIDPKLIGHNKCYSDAIFCIDASDNQEDGESIAINGGRYDSFMIEHLRQEIPAAGAVVIFKNRKLPGRLPKSSVTKKPSVYVVQLGSLPKVKTLLLVDQLRQNGIAVYQDLASDSLSTQLRDAEEKGVRYTVIMGQKEYVDGTVILRDMKARNQEHVTIASLPARLSRSRNVVAA
tara:strand:- start:3206 stop:4378 length:1173 start_codon:yes stop_codon:yes gene_type:complete